MSLILLVGTLFIVSLFALFFLMINALYAPINMRSSKRNERLNHLEEYYKAINQRS